MDLVSQARLRDENYIRSVHFKIIFIIERTSPHVLIGRHLVNENLTDFRKEFML